MIGIVDGKEATIGHYACHNRGPVKLTQIVQDGWIDGRRNEVEIKFSGSTDCRYSSHGYAMNDIRCEKCKWCTDKI